ncbi:nucleotidyl transferase AbiEii/AbiGii toxin family protein [Sulfurovum sp.]|uniref:nucleotidyl transferase AbiEii/AbiGii toxin family protein n=1 Tax=Sulfurovum sp. TaxID=1969726 RepID=UPI0025EE0042|nr:nucleotidyl transferase AbiEii/AbiGii toxin family protein [Sulfurovum sp.]
MIYPPAASLLEQFSKEAFFKKEKATLIGGTAIAFHTKHRMSFDIDICFPHHMTLPSLDFLEKYHAKPLPFDRSIVDSVINDGGEVEDYHKRFSIDGVKVDFVVNPSSNILEREILENDTGTDYGYLKITSLKALFALKSLLLLDRNKIRDLYDIVYLLTYQGFTAKEIIDTITDYRITYTDKQIIQNIQAKKADEFDIEAEGIMEPKMALVEYEALKNHLVKELQKIE